MNSHFLELIKLSVCVYDVPFTTSRDSTVYSLNWYCGSILLTGLRNSRSLITQVLYRTLTSLVVLLYRCNARVSDIRFRLAEVEEFSSFAHESSNQFSDFFSIL